MIYSRLIFLPTTLVFLFELSCDIMHIAAIPCPRTVTVINLIFVTLLTHRHMDIYGQSPRAKHQPYIGTY